MTDEESSPHEGNFLGLDSIMNLILIRSFIRALPLMSCSLFCFAAGLGLGCAEKPSESIKDVVGQHGPPQILADTFEVKEGKVTVLRLRVRPVDPSVITNFGVATNCYAVWLDALDARQDVRILYNEWERDNAYRLGGFYATRRLFFKETAHVYKISSDGKCVFVQKVRYKALSFPLQR